MNIRIKAVKDKKSSETSLLDRYVFGKPGASISGGIYLEKGKVVDEVTIVFKEGGVGDAGE